MANELEHVRAGDVISSEFCNKLIDLVNDAHEKLAGIDDLLPGSGKVAVPNLFGLSLELAKAELTRPAYGLLMGNVYNALGIRIFPENSDALVLPVLNQTPEAGKIVPIGTAVNLLIAATGTGGSSNGGYDLQVTGIKPSEGAELTQDIEIEGKNFLTPFYRNRVFFDGAFEAAPKEGSTDKSLVVKVREDIPNVPRKVSIAVQAEGITRVYDQLYLIKPKTQDTLSIIRSDPFRDAVEDSDLVLIGTGFSSVAEENKITFIINPLLPEPRPKVVVNGKSVVTQADGMYLTVHIPNFSNNCPGISGGCPNMAPSPTGTAFKITVHKGTDTTKQAIHSIAIYKS